MSNIQASTLPADLPAAAPVAAVVTEPAAPVVVTAGGAGSATAVAEPVLVAGKHAAKAPAKPAADKADVGRTAAAKPAKAATPVQPVPAPVVVSKTVSRTVARAVRPVTAKRQPKGVAEVDAQPVPKLAAKPTAKPTKAPKAAAVVKPAPKAVAKPTKKLNAKTIAVMPPITTAAGKAVRSKEKLVRDSFTMPRADFALIHQLKERGLGFKRAIRKSELLRAGLQALAAMDDALLLALLDRLPALKAGRPRKAG